MNVRTPNIDAFAASGMRFKYAYVGMSMCCPCRHELYSGLYPMHSGATWNHSTARPGTKSVCHYLSRLGYRVGLAGKCHVSPRDSYPFVMVPGFERGCCSRTNKYDCKGIRRFMTADRSQPFFLAIGLILSHTPWTIGDPSRFKADELKLPPSFADTPEVRSDYAKYLAEIAALDAPSQHVTLYLHGAVLAREVDPEIVIPLQVTCALLARRIGKLEQGELVTDHLALQAKNTLRPARHIVLAGTIKVIPVLEQTNRCLAH